jgi:hypothetical protein
MTTIAIVLNRGFGIQFIPRPSLWQSHVTKMLRRLNCISFVNFFSSIPTSFSQRVQRRNLKENVYGVLGAFNPMQRANNAGKFALANLQRMFRNFAQLNKS